MASAHDGFTSLMREASSLSPSAQVELIATLRAAGRARDAQALLFALVETKPSETLIEMARALEPTPSPPIDRISFADVAGLSAIKKRLKISFLIPASRPELREKFKTTVKGGLLLWGPPGCGKTLVGKALATELGAAFKSYGLPDILRPEFGQSEQVVSTIFAEARSQGPTVVFLDEVDALGQKRSSLTGTAARNVVVQLLTEMDGIATKGDVFVVGATNHPWDIDPAFRRSGRFDYSLFVPPPDEEARAEILRREMEGRPSGPIDYAGLARLTNQYSGADLALLVKSASEQALLAAIDDPNRLIEMRDFDVALKSVRSTAAPWMQDAANVAQFGVEEVFYEPLRLYLNLPRRG